MTNIALAAFFFALLVSGIMASKVSINAIYFAFFINLYLATFNLIPFGPLDWEKDIRSKSFSVGDCNSANDTDSIVGVVRQRDILSKLS
jgi:hypothetical protein